jgi:hypothetical protein
MVLRGSSDTLNRGQFYNNVNTWKTKSIEVYAAIIAGSQKTNLSDKETRRCSTWLIGSV